jgi:hypothetical protein
MYNRNHLFAFMLAASACAAPHYMSVPKQEGIVGHVIAPDPYTKAHFSNTLKPLNDENNVLYRQEFGGGGAALGVLLGPIGVAANAAAIGSATSADVELLKGKLPLDPTALYRDVAKDFPELAEPNIDVKSVAVRVSPKVLIVKAEGEVLLLGCTLTVDYRPAGLKWVGHYVYQTTLKYAKAEVAQNLTSDQIKRANAELRAGFQALTALYFDDLHGKLPLGHDVRFKSAYLSPRNLFELHGQQLPGTADRAVIRGTSATYSFPRAGIEVAAAEPASDS